MKPILSKQVQRGNNDPRQPDKTLNEWVGSESQATVDGLNAFQQRQRDRIAAAQANATEAKTKVRALKARK